MSVTAWSESHRCWCGDPREPGEAWCRSCGRYDKVDERSQAREAAKHAESNYRKTREEA